MLELAAEQVGDGGEPDVRVRPHVDALAGQELGRPGLVEEDERPDHLPLRRRQRAAHLEAAEVAGARHDQRLDGVDARRRSGSSGRASGSSSCRALRRFAARRPIPGGGGTAPRRTGRAAGSSCRPRARPRRARATSACPTPWPRKASGTSVWSMMIEPLAGLGEGHLRLVVADAIDVAALAVGLLQRRCRSGSMAMRLPPCLGRLAQERRRRRRSPTGRSRGRPGCQCVVDRRALRAEPGLERPGRLRRADRIALAGGDQHPRRHRRRLRRPRDQRMHQHRARRRAPAARRSRSRGCWRRWNSRGRSPRDGCAAATCASTKAAIAAVRRARSSMS